MITKYGISGLNAEVEIDYEKKDVKYRYPYLRRNNFKKAKKTIETAFFGEGALWGIVIGFAIACKYIIYAGLNLNWAYPGTTMYYMISTYASTIAIFYILAGALLAGYTTLLLNCVSEKWRQGFAYRQAKLNYKPRWKVIELPTTDGKQIIEGNKMWILDYDIISFEYKYYGKNKLKKLTTKSTESRSRRLEHFDFIAELVFEKPITEGVFMYK